MPFLQVIQLCKSYPSSRGPNLEVLRNLDLGVETGEMVAVTGASGVGKTTLMQSIGGLDRIDRGTIRVSDTEVSSLSDDELSNFRNRHVGFVFQFHHLLPEFNALENIEMPLRISGLGADEAQHRARQLLDQVGLADRWTHRPGKLSGGEQQRVAVARALVMHPALLLADEPTGDLDARTGESLHRLLREMHEQHGLTSVIATHNPRLAKACDRVLSLEDGHLNAR